MGAVARPAAGAVEITGVAAVGGVTRRDPPVSVRLMLVPRKVKTRGPTVSANRGRKPLRDALDKINRGNARTFTAIEPIFLTSMRAFDEGVVRGDTTQGDERNGKGDFLNDVLALLLERASGKELHTRPGVPGLLLNHKLDVAYPSTGQVELTVETKAAGIPKHKRNPSQKHPEGRAGSADLDKRVKEAAFKDIDIKGHYASGRGGGGGATSDLTTWLRQTPPRNFLFLSVRVRDDADRRAAEHFARVAGQWFDACGLYCYGWKAAHTEYEPKMIDATVRLQTVFDRVATLLRNLP